MTDQPLATLRDIAAELQLPESTVRYYRDAFVHHVPTVGSGRRRRYPPDAVAMLRLIALLYQEGRSRDQIEYELSQLDVPEPHQRPMKVSEVMPRQEVLRPPAETGALLRELLEGERERRDAMWQMVREVVRLGGAIERQHAALMDISERLALLSDRALPSGDASPAPPSGTTADLLRELEALRVELARLRRSKLEIERRAAEAEAEERVAELREEDPTGRRSMLGRLLSRDE
jgi:DNA-binding transcriptional MerR regulator